MRIGVAKEIKEDEHRVGATPAGVRHLVGAGHEVHVERGAGAGSGFADEEYENAGATLTDAAGVWGCDVLVKVKEPIAAEYPFFRGQILFAYLHLAAAPPALTAALLRTGTTAIAYETIQEENGRLPLLAPMSAMAGSIAPLMGSYYLARFNGGRGTLLGNILGKRYGKVVIVGDGVVGRHACNVASGLGAHVVVLGLFPERAAEFERLPGVRYLLSNPANLAAELPDADLLVGAVLIAGARAARVVTEAMVKTMPRGSVAVDVSIDQGGCIATSRPTTHSAPVFVAHGVTHYCVTNMPGAFARTATIALTDATLPYVARLAASGVAAARADPVFGKGFNTEAGSIVHPAVAEALRNG